MPKGGKKFRSANQYVGKRKKKAGTKRKASEVAAVSSVPDTPIPSTSGSSVSTLPRDDRPRSEKKLKLFKDGGTTDTPAEITEKTKESADNMIVNIGNLGLLLTELKCPNCKVAKVATQ